MGENDKRFLYQFIYRFGLKAALLILLWRWLVRPIFIIVHTCFMFCRSTWLHIFGLFFSSSTFRLFILFLFLVVFNCLLMCVCVVVRTNHYPFLDAPKLFVFGENDCNFVCVYVRIFSAIDIDFINYPPVRTQKTWPAPTSVVGMQQSKWHSNLCKNQWFLLFRVSLAIESWKIHVTHKQFCFSQIVVYVIWAHGQSLEYFGFVYQSRCGKINSTITVQALECILTATWEIEGKRQCFGKNNQNIEISNTINDLQNTIWWSCDGIKIPRSTYDHLRTRNNSFDRCLLLLHGLFSNCMNDDCASF